MSLYTLNASEVKSMSFNDKLSYLAIFIEKWPFGKEWR
jgi:hypothetical protein